MSNPDRLSRWPALCWLICLLAAAGFLILKQPWAGRVDTDLLALLPHDERRPVLESALKALSAQGEKQLALLVSGKDEADARQAVVLAREALNGLGLKEQSSSMAFPDEFYFPFRQSLLTQTDRQWLEQADTDKATARAVGLAYALFSSGNLSWQSDPYGFFGDWLKQLGEATPLRPFGGELMVEREGSFWAALTYTLPQSAFDVDFQEKLEAGINDARQRLHARDSQAQLLRAGVVLHAAAATHQAQAEMQLIGLGSLLGTFFLIGIVFQSLRALKLIAVSLVSGATIALAAVFLSFERVHLVTLVFGASLVGVAVDYAILVFAQHLGSTESARQRFWRLLPTLCAALLTPVLAYLALALTPFPGLRQMAVFAVCGIFGAWASVLCFYPWLLPATLPLPKNAGLMTSILANWPRWKNSRQNWALAALLVAIMAGGFAQLRVNDDIRGLFSGDKVLLDEHTKVSRIMGLPSPAQMFLLTADSPEALLQREEALVDPLRTLVQQGRIGGYEAVSRWLPSLKKQQQAHALQTRLKDSRLQLAEEYGLPEADETALLAPETWLASEISTPFRVLWLGSQGTQVASIVMLKGLADKDVADTLSKLSTTLPGVEWVDQTREISTMMARYRSLLTKTLLLACVIAPMLLIPFFRSRVWCIITPVLLAGGMTLALMGYLGIPIQLLSILALLLTLGMGVDYAIFLQARQGHAHTLLATTLAASLTLLSFGLLAASGTPALHALGLTATLGVTLSWLLTPVFVRKNQSESSSSSASS